MCKRVYETNKDSGNVVVENFCDHEIPRLVFAQRRNDAGAKLPDCVVPVQRHEVADRLLVVTRHKYHT